FEVGVFMEYFELEPDRGGGHDEVGDRKSLVDAALRQLTPDCRDQIPYVVRNHGHQVGIPEFFLHAGVALGVGGHQRLGENWLTNRNQPAADNLAPSRVDLIAPDSDQCTRIDKVLHRSAASMASKSRPPSSALRRSLSKASSRRARFSST